MCVPWKRITVVFIQVNACLGIVVGLQIIMGMLDAVVEDGDLDVLTSVTLCPGIFYIHVQSFLASVQEPHLWPALVIEIGLEGLGIHRHFGYFIFHQIANISYSLGTKGVQALALAAGGESWRGKSRWHGSCPLGKWWNLALWGKLTTLELGWRRTERWWRSPALSELRW